MVMEKGKEVELEAVDTVMVQGMGKALDKVSMAVLADMVIEMGKEVLVSGLDKASTVVLRIFSGKVALEDMAGTSEVAG